MDAETFNRLYLNPRLHPYLENEAYRYSIEMVLSMIHAESIFNRPHVETVGSLPQGAAAQRQAKQSGLPWYLAYCMGRFETGEWTWQKSQEKVKRYLDFRRRWQQLRLGGGAVE